MHMQPAAFPIQSVRITRWPRLLCVDVQERACLAEQLAEKERLLQEREEELQALQRVRSGAAS